MAPKGSRRSAAGVFAYVPKPFDFGRLELLISTALFRGARQRRSPERRSSLVRLASISPSAVRFTPSRDPRIHGVPLRRGTSG